MRKWIVSVLVADLAILVATSPAAVDPTFDTGVVDTGEPPATACEPGATRAVGELTLVLGAEEPAGLQIRRTDPEGGLVSASLDVVATNEGYDACELLIYRGGPDADPSLLSRPEPGQEPLAFVHGWTLARTTPLPARFREHDEWPLDPEQLPELTVLIFGCDDVELDLEVSVRECDDDASPGVEARRL